MRAHGEFDIAIVGGGAAGCVLARRLSEATAASVLLLEAGPDLGSTVPPDLRDGWHIGRPPDWGYAAEPHADGNPVRLRRGRLLGGTSWLTRFAVRGAAADFDRWAARGNRGWSFPEVLPAFRRLESDLELGDQPWHGDRGPIPITRYPAHEVSEVHGAALAALAASGFPSVPDLNAPEAMGVGRIPMNSRAGRRITTVDAYLADGWSPSNLTVRPDSPVDQLVIDGSRAVGVRLLSGDEIRAGLIVLAGGTYGSPLVLLRSGIGPADELRRLGIAVRHDLPSVGMNLADHPGVDFDTGWRGVGVAGPVLHSLATYRSATADADGPDLMFWISDPEAGDDPRFYLDPILLRPRSRGSIRLRSSDPAEAPLIELPGLREDLDVERLVEGYRRALEIANVPALRRLCPEPAPVVPRSAAAWRRVVTENAYSLPHVVGTCAMGPADDATAVVDARGRVHGLDGLAVVDASIIPEPPSGYPHLVTIMAAEHLAPTLTAP